MPVGLMDSAERINDLVKSEFSNKRLLIGSRMKTMNDFGFVVLEISGIQTEDSGQYVCIARNKFGEDRTQFMLQCTGAIETRSIRPVKKCFFYRYV